MQSPRGNPMSTSPRRVWSTRAVRAAYNAQFRSAPLEDSDRYYDWLAQKVVRHLPDAQGHTARIVDVGCGSGRLLAALARRLEDAVLVGIDISDAALALCGCHAPTAQRMLAQGEYVPLAGDVYDAVLCSGNLEHFVDPSRGAQELARLCRRDGTVWVLLPNSFYSGDIWRVIRGGYGPNHHQIIDRFATVNEWRDLLESSGLTVDGITPYNRFKWWKRLLPRNLAYHFLYRTHPTT